ncbi:hypothetical protein C900_04394 [Fulvivirga imtechensis AK7]|uniref:Uncharacterized protein n=1 Tax=Fulvivirga imtechensis AK7 TaxID=1237149 RepID=L8JRA3_9BACT|nr:hypothetical protein C900_04394 [Fulvivirga imtechensis AK7]
MGFGTPLKEHKEYYYNCYGNYKAEDENPNQLFRNGVVF